MGRIATRKPVTEQGAPEGSVEDYLEDLADAFRAQFPALWQSDAYHYAYACICGTFPAEQYVIVCQTQDGDEDYFRYDFTVDAGVVAFGQPTPMEIAYVPADAQAEAARFTAVHRDGRRQFAETRELHEAAFDQAANTLSVTVIREGFNVPRSRYYTESAVRSGADIFRGLKMYSDHATAAEEKARPEGSLRDWVATLTETAYDQTGKRLRGTAKIIDPQFAEKVALLDTQGLLNTLGLSIRAIGAGEDTVIESARTFRVDEFAAGRSVDFVTEPGAGGYVEWRESAADDSDVDVISLARLRERRPDLVAAIQRESHQEVGTMGLQEDLDAARGAQASAEQKARAAEEARVAAESALATVQAEQQLAHAQEAIGKLIAESKLPEASRVHLRETLTAEGDVDKARAAIEAHAKLVADLTGAGRVRGNGETVTESGAPDLQAAFSRFPGMNEASAAVAARGGR